MVIRKPLDFVRAVAKAFVRAMNNYFAEEDPTKRDAITAHQLDVLRQYRGPRETPLRLSKARRMVVLMNNKA